MTQNSEVLSLKEKVDSLIMELEGVGMKLEMATQALRIEELQESLRMARAEKDLDRESDLKQEVALETAPMPDRETVRKQGLLVTDIDWQNNVKIPFAYCWNECQHFWQRLKDSHFDGNEVCGLVMWGWMVVSKHFKDQYKLVKYEGKYYWIKAEL